MSARRIRQFTAEQRIFAGEGSLNSLGSELERGGSSRPVIICGRTIGGNDALLQRLRDASGGRIAGVWSGVESHSPVPSLLAAARFLSETAADAVIAVGGGSAIVTARAASIVSAELIEGKSVRDLATFMGEGGRLQSPKLLAPKLPQFIVPTTPTTAYPKAGSAVFEPDTNTRLAMFDPKVRARAIFAEPDFLATAPADLVLSASLNAFAMAIEGLCTDLGNPISDAFQLHALRILVQHLTDPAKDAFSADARMDLFWAAGLCGMGTDSSGGGVTLALGHATGMVAHTSNGLTNAVTLPATLAFNGASIHDALPSIASAIGASDDGDALTSVTGRLAEIFAFRSLPTRLRDLGVPVDTVPEIARQAMRDWVMTQTPRKVQDPVELEAILRNCW